MEVWDTLSLDLASESNSNETRLDKMFNEFFNSGKKEKQNEQNNAEHYENKVVQN